MIIDYPLLRQLKQTVIDTPFDCLRLSCNGPSHTDASGKGKLNHFRLNILYLLASIVLFDAIKEVREKKLRGSPYTPGVIINLNQTKPGYE
ncbi:MAG: hypothetical protein GVY20_09170 [Bacteroidetes bacterium]|nr:hypothetical protein [Bacteroidota bacterium]